MDKATPKGRAQKAGRGTGILTTRERYTFAGAAQKAATAWTHATWPTVPEERLKDRDVGFADGFASAIRVLVEAGIIVEEDARVGVLK